MDSVKNYSIGKPVTGYYPEHFQDEREKSESADGG